MNSTLRLLCITAFLTSSTLVNAALVNNGTFSTDLDSDLDWLKLTETLDLSYNEVSAEFGVGGNFDGWRYATIAEFDTLLSNAGAVASTGCAVGVTYCGWTTENNGFYAWFSQYIGVTNDQGYVTSVINGETVQELAGWSYGLLADSASATERYAGWLSNRSDANKSPTKDYIANPFHVTWKDQQSSATRGSFLVRSSVSAVPLPPSLLLFASSLIALFSRKLLSNK